MDSQDLESAADFCKLVGKPNLLVYLGVSEDAEAGEARAKLKSRRKFMQGMQSNPKYKREALFLIKHFSGLSEVLSDVPGYLVDARRRAESEHLPVLEMTVRGVLAAGGLTADQEDYLRRNAVELGVSEATFRELLHRLAGELGIPMKGGLPTPAPPPGREGPLDLYQLLGISTNATIDDIRVAHDHRLSEIGDKAESGGERKRIEIARKVLSNEAARRHYDLTAARTGPPARSREFRPDQAATAPPVRERTFDPRPAAASGGETASRLEILGDPVRAIRLGTGITTSTITIRNGGGGAMGGTVTVDVGWIDVDPARLDPATPEQDVSVQIDRQDVPENATTGVVTIETDRGERARVVFEVKRGPAPQWILALVIAAVILGAVFVGLAMQVLKAPG